MPVAVRGVRVSDQYSMMCAVPWRLSSRLVSSCGPRQRSSWESEGEGEVDGACDWIG